MEQRSITAIKSKETTNNGHEIKLRNDLFNNCNIGTSSLADMCTQIIRAVGWRDGAYKLGGP